MARKKKEISLDEFAKLLLDEMTFMEANWYASQMGFRFIVVPLEKAGEA